jgi:hypothetical protein
MGRLTKGLLAIAFVVCAVSSLFANNGPLEITLDNLANGGGYWESPFTESNAASGGALWIAKQSSGYNSSSSPNGPVLLDQDVNLQIAANVPNQGWVTIGQDLLSSGTALLDVTGNDYGAPYNPPWGGYFDLANSGASGTWTSANSYNILPSIQLEIWAWTGNYNDVATAANNNQYVLDGTTSGGQNIFNEPVTWSSSTGTWQADFSGMPALTLVQEAGGSTPPQGGGGEYTPHPGDANLDGRVDINDLTIVLTNYGRTDMTWTLGDFTGDGTVDINDLTIVLANYGWTGTYEGVMKDVPEPSTVVLLGMAAAIGLLALAKRGWPR